MIHHTVELDPYIKVAVSHNLKANWRAFISYPKIKPVETLKHSCTKRRIFHDPLSKFHKSWDAKLKECDTD